MKNHALALLPALLFALGVAGCHAKTPTYCQRNCAHARACSPGIAGGDCEARCQGFLDKLLAVPGVDAKVHDRRRRLVDCQDDCYKMPLGEPVQGAANSSKECRAIADCERDCRTRYAGAIREDTAP